MQVTVFVVALRIVVQKMKVPDWAIFTLLLIIVDAARTIVLVIRFALSAV